MRRIGRLLLSVLILGTLCAIVPMVVYGQSGAGGESSVVSGNGGNETTLPSDFPTRESFQPPSATPQALGPSVADYVRMIVGLVVVLLVIWGLSQLMKRFVVARGLASSTDSLKVLYTQSLSPSRTLYLVRFSDRILLIGAGEGGLRTLGEISDPEEVSAILKETEFKGDFEKAPFKEKLKNMMGDDGSEYVPDNNLEKRQRRMKGTMEKLKKMQGGKRE